MPQHFAQAYPYAEALFNLAKQDNALPEWQQILAGLSLVAENKDILNILQNPQVAKAQLYKLLLTILDSAWEKSAKAKQAAVLLELLVKHQRVAISPEIAALYEKLREEEENSTQAIATSAIDLSEEQKKRLKTALEKRLNKNILLQYTTDDSVLGGVKVQIGDTVFDGTVATQLKNLRTCFYLLIAHSFYHSALFQLNFCILLIIACQYN